MLFAPSGLKDPAFWLTGFWYLEKRVEIVSL